MLRISLCLLLALFFIPEAGAQTGASKPFAFDNSLLARKAGMRSFSVQDLRKDTSWLGGRGRSWWDGGAPDCAVPFTRQVQQFGTALLREGAASDDQLVMQLRSLKVQEHNGIGCVFLDAAFFVQRGERTIAGFNKVLYLETPRPHLDSALNALFFRLIDSAATLTTTDAPRFRDTPGHPSLHPLLTRKGSKRGVYRNYREVMTNLPSETLFAMIGRKNAGQTEMQFYRSDTKKNAGVPFRPEEFYAVFTGNRWYISTPDGPKQVENEGGQAVAYCRQPGLAVAAEHTAYRRGGLLSLLLPDGYYFYETKYEFGIIEGIPDPRFVQTPILYRTLIRSDDGSIIPIERIME